MEDKAMDKLNGMSMDIEQAERDKLQSILGAIK